MNRATRSRANRPLGNAALKFIRMVMASYFIALSVDLIAGVDTAIFFTPFMQNDTADLVGSAITLYCAALLFFGLFLRLASLYLAIMVLTASIVQNFFHTPIGNVEAFWQDLVVVCGLLLTYCTLSPREMRRQAFIMQQIPQSARDLKGRVAPRRIARTGTEAAPKPLAFSTPTAPPTRAPEPEAEPQAPARARLDPYTKVRSKYAEFDDDDVVNIFAA